MGNDKLRSEKPEVRRSRICKSIERTLNTAKFESIVIKEEIDEEIEWTSVEEWNKKHNNWTLLLIDRFKATHDKVLQELGLEHKKAYFVNNLENSKDRSDTYNSTLGDLDELH